MSTFLWPRFFGYLQCKYIWCLFSFHLQKISTANSWMIRCVMYLWPNVLTLSSTSSSGQATFMLTGGFGKLGSSSSSRYVGLTRTEVARRWWLLLVLLLSNFWLRLPFLDWTLLGECRLRWRCSRSPPPPPAASTETVTASAALLLVLVDSILVFLSLLLTW